MKYTQEDIVEGCRRKDREYQKALYEEYSAELYTLCRRYMDNKEDAEDIFQDSFVKVFCANDKFVNIINLRAWIKRVFLNNVLNALKLRKRFAAVDIETIEDDSDVFDVDADQYSTRDLIEALQSLKKEERIVFNMAEMEDMPYKEIEKMTGRKATSLRSVNMRAKRKMRDFLVNKKGQKDG